LSENNTEKEFTYIIFAKENNLLFTIPIVKIRYATTDMAKFKVVKSQCSCHEQLRDKIEKLHTPPVGNLAPFQREISFSFPMRMLAFHCLPFLVLLLPGVGQALAESRRSVRNPHWSWIGSKREGGLRGPSAPLGGEPREQPGWHPRRGNRSPRGAQPVHSRSRALARSPGAVHRAPLGQSTWRAVPQLAADPEAAARLDWRSCLQGGLIGQMRAVPYIHTP